MSYDLAPAADAVAALLPRVRDDQLDDPTPCEGSAVSVILFHLIGLSTAFRDAARKDLGATTSTPPDATAHRLPDDWRTTLPRLLDELTDAWREPTAWEGMTQAGGTDLPGGVAGHVALNELTIHGWDLAVATGLPYQPDDASLHASYELLAPSADSGGLFGPPIDVPADAPLLDRVLGLSGRSPSWTPPA